MKLKILKDMFKIVKHKRHDNINFENVFNIVFEEKCISCIYKEKRFLKKDNLWKCLKIDEILEFSMAGILESIIYPISKINISVLVVSSFDTDYIFIREEQFGSAIKMLADKGFDVYE